MRPSGLLLLFAVILVLCNQPPLPQNDRFQTSNSGNPLDHLPAEDLAFDGQAPPLLSGEPDSLLHNYLPKYQIFAEEIFDHTLLLKIYPADENQEQRLPWLQKTFTFSSGFAVRFCSIRHYQPLASQIL